MLRTSHDNIHSSNEQRELARSLSGHLKVMNNRKEFSDGILMLIIKIHKQGHLIYFMMVSSISMKVLLGTITVSSVNQMKFGQLVELV